MLKQGAAIYLGSNERAFRDDNNNQWIQLQKEMPKDCVQSYDYLSWLTRYERAFENGSKSG